jgi:hypothetical protein
VHFKKWREQLYLHHEGAWQMGTQDTQSAIERQSRPHVEFVKNRLGDALGSLYAHLKYMVLQPKHIMYKAYTKFMI